MKQYDSLQKAILDLYGDEINSVQPVSGGDINRSYRLSISGKAVFMKAKKLKRNYYIHCIIV